VFLASRYDERTTRATFLVDPDLLAALAELIATRGPKATKREWLESHIRADLAAARRQEHR